MFNISIPSNVLFGEGILQSELPRIVGQYGVKRILLVTDAGLVKAGVVTPVVNLLIDHGLQVEVFSDVEPDPSVDTVHRVADAFLKMEGQLLLGLGGGSSIDTAKGARVIISNGGHIREFSGLQAKTIERRSNVPLIAVPTTAGTGSEVTFFGVFSDWENNVKVTVTSAFLAPDVSLVDPTLTYTLPPHITASSGIDVLAHAIEAFVSKNSSPFSDAIALRAVELVSENLRTTVLDGTNKSARNHMAQASLLAGIAFNHAFLGLTHAVAAAISGHAHVPHGVAIGLLLPHVVQFNTISNPDKFRQLSQIMAGAANTAGDTASLVESLAREIGIPEHLRDVGVTREMLGSIAEQSMQSVQLRFNPREASKQAILDLVTSIY